MWRKSQIWITLLYVCAVMAPYFVPAMNNIRPRLIGMPFPLWWSLLWVLAYNIYLFVLGKRTWCHYDKEPVEGKEEIGK